MTIFAFSAAVNGLDLDNIGQLDALYTEDFILIPSEVDGVTSISVEIEADSGKQALQRLMKHLQSAPVLTLARVDPDLVNVPEIADRLDISREMVRLLAEGKRGDGDFPKHLTTVGNQKVWAWADVHAWAVVHHRLPEGEPSPLDRRLVDRINGQLATGSHTVVKGVILEAQWASSKKRVQNWTLEPSHHFAVSKARKAHTSRTGGTWRPTGAYDVAAPFLVSA